MHLRIGLLSVNETKECGVDDKVDLFLTALAKLSIKHGVEISSCNCHGCPLTLWEMDDSTKPLARFWWNIERYNFVRGEYVE